ncbi:MAG: TonB-dependent receptor plug domain-containing protein, partial [Alphaproteobacteria bacterium]|nr:TonB-dependent receptor plug domain-containing protein [Alphaproteobacteria bacterium]
NSLEDVARSTPQLTIVRGGSGSGTSISIRGIFSSNTSIGIEQSVSIILDGVYYPQGRVMDEGLYDVSQVAILKGPQALYFGKNATAGVVSITTNDPGPDFEAKAQVGYEVVGQRLTGEAMVSVPVNDKFGIRLAARGTKMWGGYLENIAGATSYTTVDAATLDTTVHPNPAPVNKKWPGEESIFARLTAKGTPSDYFTYTIKGSYADYQIDDTQGTELWACPALDGQPHTAVPDPNNPGFTMPVPNTQAECHGDWKKAANPIPPDIAKTNPLLSKFGGQLGEIYKSYGITGNFKYAREKYDITAILNYHHQETFWVGDFDGGGATAIFADEHNTFRNFSTEVRGVTHFDFPVNAVLGVYYQRTHRYFFQDVYFAGTQNTAVTDPADEYVSYNKLSETKGETISLYGELVWDITDQWQLTGGARYTHETKDSYFEQPYVNPFVQGLFVQGRLPADGLVHQVFENGSPEITLRWEPNRDLTFYVAYKQGFKSGGFSNSAIYSTLTTDQLGDITFDPEKVRGFEGGVKASLFDGAMRLELEGYHYVFKNLQIDFFNSPTFAYITENAGSAKTDGAELQLTWAPKDVDGLTLSGSLAYNVSKYGDFIAPCYAGQTPAQGCMPSSNPGEVPKQQLAGQYRALAPKWSGSLGADYTRPIGDGLKFGVSANVVYKSKYLLGAFNNPYDVQKGYATVDASLRFGTEDDRWQFAIIGKNLTKKYALVASGDTPSTGGNTGYPSGFVADRTGTPIYPRTVEFRVTYHY